MKELNMQEEYLPREIKMIVIHSSSTRCDRSFPPAQLEALHKTRGFRCIVYHFYVTRDGRVYHTRPISEIGAHAPGFNLHSIGICYEGGLSPEGQPMDTRTTFQKAALFDILSALKKQYPTAVIKGHFQLSADVRKTCPCFNAEQEYPSL